MVVPLHRLGAGDRGHRGQYILSPRLRDPIREREDKALGHIGGHLLLHFHPSRPAPQGIHA